MKNDALDPSRSMMIVEIVYEHGNWLEDARGENGTERKKLAMAFAKKAHAKTGISGDEAISIYATDIAAHGIGKWVGETPRISGEWASFGVESVADVKRVSRRFDREGFNYDFPYVIVQGLMLFPQGFNGPRFGVESSNESRSLDEWVERNDRAPRKSSSHRANPIVDCRGKSDTYNRYRSAMVLHNGEWVKVDGCWAGAPAKVPSYHGTVKRTGKGTTISKKVVRQKASRTAGRVKGVRARSRK